LPLIASLIRYDLRDAGFEPMLLIDGCLGEIGAS